MKPTRVCRQLVQRIRDVRFEHKGRRFTLGACAGIAPITRDATTAGDIMVQADMACYRAKSEGSGRVMLYEADEVGFRRLEAEMGWAADFAQALEANQFLPYRQLIQPTSSTGQPHYEVLIRWQRDGVIEGPAKLLPALERYGQAPILDRWMLEAVICLSGGAARRQRGVFHQPVRQDRRRRSPSSDSSAICSITMAWQAHAWDSRSRKPPPW